MVYSMRIAGLERDLPLCKVTDDFYIAAFVMLGDAEITTACAKAMLKLTESVDYDYIFTAEAKSIPLADEMARLSGAKKYFVARKGKKVYMPEPVIGTEDNSITTQTKQHLFLGADDAALIRGKKILIVDDVISTGGSLNAMEFLVQSAGGIVVGRAAVLAEGDAADRDDILYLEKLPTFHADGTPQ